MELNSTKVKNKKMETLVEEDEEAMMSAPENKSSCGVSSANSDFDESGEVKIPALDKYNLRTKSIQNRIEIEKKRKSPRPKQPKPKQRPAPLSKYRRKTANARERTRMQEINEAFEELRSVVPQEPIVETPSSDKLTKITTLRLAVNYIAALSRLLEETEPSNSTAANDRHDQQQQQQHQLYSLGHHQQQSGHSAHSTAGLTSSTFGSTMASNNTGFIINNSNNISPTTNQIHTSTASTIDPSLNSLGFSPLEFGLSAELSEDDLVSDLDASFLLRQDISNRPSSCTSSDLASTYNSPSTTETESIESFTSACGGGWDFPDDSLDVPDTFDLILESDGEGNI